MKWSKISNSEVFLEAYTQLCDNHLRGCHYHNLFHVESMYGYLHDTEEPYNEALDWAVIFHDAVYDENPFKEQRSAKFFQDVARKYEDTRYQLSDSLVNEASLMILSTEAHVIGPYTSKHQKSLIRADLHQLAEKQKTVENYAKIMRESVELYGCTVEEFAEKNIDFMNGLRHRMVMNLSYIDKEHSEFFYNVIAGIDLTRDMSNLVKEKS